MLLPTAYSINDKARTIEDAIDYIRYRDKQLLKFGFKVNYREITPKQTAIICKYDKSGVSYGAIYILDQFTGLGLYGELMNSYDIKTIVTLPECNIPGYLEKKNISYVLPTHSQAYRIIQSYYKDSVTKRSKVPLIYHIEEGGAILESLSSSDVVKDAYYLHPILQNDKDFVKNKANDFHGVPTESLLLAMEYRMVANSYLSNMERKSFIGLTCEEVRQMLIADKVQNYKDFLLYHNNTHERSTELRLYFNEWFDILKIDYESAVQCIKSEV